MLMTPSANPSLDRGSRRRYRLEDPSARTPERREHTGALQRSLSEGGRVAVSWSEICRSAIVAGLINKLQSQSVTGSGRSLRPVGINFGQDQEKL